MSFKWKIEIELEVSDNWIEDGFNMSDKFRLDMLEEHFQSDQLPYSYGHEVVAKVTITEAPDKHKILTTQGYNSDSPEWNA